MKRVNFTDGIELVVGDMNKMVTLAEQNLSDYVLKQLFQNQSDLFFNDSFKVIRNSNTAVNVSAGLGWVYQTQINSAEAENRFVVLESSAGLSVTPDAALNRIDIVVIEPSIADGDTESRRTKSSDFGAVTNENRVVTKAYGATISIVQGVPAASPVAPAIPAGKVKIAEILVTAITGIINQAAITDSRNTVSKLSEDFSEFANGTTIGLPTAGKKRIWLKQGNELFLRDSTGADLRLNPTASETALAFNETDSRTILTTANRSLSAGVGLTGGGDLSNDRSFALGAPSTCTSATANSATGTTHTHTISLTTNYILGLVAGGVQNQTGTYAMARITNNAVTYEFGDLIAGSGLIPCSASGEISTYGNLSGTWKCLGHSEYVSGSLVRASTIWLRVV
jgi:hypothetical protein